MPAFLAHYACGVSAFNQMKDGYVKRSVEAHKNVFNTALAGPDIFFYSVVETLKPGFNIGRVMHKYRSGAFLKALFEESLRYEEDDRMIATAYAAGFMGHYSLDQNAHPLVFGKTQVPGSSRRSLGKHFRYEAAMDVYVCREVLGRDINDSHQLGLIHMTARERKIVSEVLYRTIRKVYPDACHKVGRVRMKLILNGYYILTGILIDPTGFKEWLALGFEKLKNGYPHMSPLLINRNLYGIGHDEYLIFKKRFDRGVDTFLTILPALEEAAADPQHKTDALCKVIGNRSYHTGKEMEKEQTLHDR